MRPAAAAGVVHVFSGSRSRTGHEGVTRMALAAQIASLLGYRFGGESSAPAQQGTRVYWVPADTLVGGEATRLGIATEDDLLGGVVGHPFAATKTITHPLVDPGATAPTGWTGRFAEQVERAVLPGYSVFAIADGVEAGRRLLADGPVRVKAGQGVGGRGQWVVADSAQLMKTLTELDPAQLKDFGVVLERDLSDVVTYSIGTIHLGGISASYHGIQQQVCNHDDQWVYGGSDLWMVRGDFDALAARPLPTPIRQALAQARCYDQATATLPGFYASRRNYDVVSGRDATGQRHIGVLEQSWRIGGATPAEVAAVEAFAADPQLSAIKAASHERYGLTTPPAGASIHYRDTDPVVGPMTKYTVVERYADPT